MTSRTLRLGMAAVAVVASAVFVGVAATVALVYGAGLATLALRGAEGRRPRPERSASSWVTPDGRLVLTVGRRDPQRKRPV